MSNHRHFLYCVCAGTAAAAGEARGVSHAPLRTRWFRHLIFPAILFIWPPEDGSDTLRVVAAKNSQAKNISTSSVRASIVHAAACMRVQNLSNSNMSAGSKDKKLQTMWKGCRVLILEEISMVSAILYNMLDFRSMLGRRFESLRGPADVHPDRSCFWPRSHSSASGRLLAAASHCAVVALGRLAAER